MSQNTSGRNAGIIVLVVGLVLLVPCLLGALGLAGMVFCLSASPAPPPTAQAIPETPMDIPEPTVVTTDADDPTKLTFDVKPGEWPLNDQIVRHGEIAVFSSQAGEDLETTRSSCNL